MLVRLGHVTTHLLLMLADIFTQVVGMSPGSRSPVNDNIWHTVFIRRQIDKLQLTVDDREIAPITGQFHLKY